MNAPLLTVTVAAVTAGASVAGQVGLGVAVLACQGLLVLGWYATTGLPARRAGAAAALGGGLVADGLTVLKGQSPSIGPVGAVLAAIVMAAFVQQLRRAHTHEGVTATATGTVTATATGTVTATVTGTVTAGVLAVLMSALVAERGAPQGRTVTVATILAAGLASAVLARGRRPPPVVSRRPDVHARWVDRDVHARPGAVAGALGIGGAVGLVAGVLAPDVGIPRAIAVSGAAAVFAIVARNAYAFAGPVATPVSTPAAVPTPAPVPHEAAAAPGVRAGGRSTGRAAQRAAARAARRHGEAVMLLGATLPLALAAPVAYLLGRLLVG